MYTCKRTNCVKYKDVIPWERFLLEAGSSLDLCPLEVLDMSLFFRWSSDIAVGVHASCSISHVSTLKSFNYSIMSLIIKQHKV